MVDYIHHNLKTLQVGCGDTSNVIIVFKLFEYVKLVEIAIVMFIGNVEDELTFCTMTFMKF
jgi:hypothetical protein